MLKVGDRIPPFTLMASNGVEVSNESLAGQRYVLYSYPKDDTPGCTKEACSFRDNLPKFGELGVAVYGLSADDEKSHIRFGRKYALNFPLLADPERRLIEPLGVWVEKRMYGKAYMGVARSTFVVGPDGVIEQVWEKVDPEGHAEAVLAWLGANAASKPQDPAAGRAAAKPARAAAKPKAPHAAAQPAAKAAKRTASAQGRPKPTGKAAKIQRAQAGRKPVGVAKRARPSTGAAKARPKAKARPRAAAGAKRAKSKARR